jgi:hypothetical protein
MQSPILNFDKNVLILIKHYIDINEENWISKGFRIFIVDNIKTWILYENFHR